MRRSKFYNMRLPERGAREGEANDAADIEDLTYDLGIIDAEMERQRLEDVRLEKDKATKLEMSQHKSAAVLDHPDGSVTDAKLGQRTVLTTSGPLQTLLTAIGNAIKAVSGADTWNGTPATTLTAAKAHMDGKSNPHGVTKAQVGLGNVPNVATNDQTPTYTAASAPAALASGEKLSVAFGKLAAGVSSLIAHLADGVKHITAAERTKWNGAVDAQHSHTNKALLDTYTQTEANLASAVSSKHSHSNKSVLDGITSTLISTWDSVSSKLPLAGGTLTGFLTLHAAPTDNMHAVTKKYVDDKMAASGSGDMTKAVYDPGGRELPYIPKQDVDALAWGGDFGASGTPVSIAYAGAQRIASITAYGENAQGGTTEAPVALTGVDSVFVSGNNLLPKAVRTETTGGITFTPNPDGSILVSGTATTNVGYSYAHFERALLGRTVCLSGGSTQAQVLINERLSSGAFVRNVLVDRGQGISGILTKQKEDNILYATIQVLAGTTVNTTIYPMLNLGESPLPYEPYQGSVTPLPIPRPLRRVGDVKDKCVTRQDYESAEKLVVTYNVGFVELNGTEASHIFEGMFYLDYSAAWPTPANRVNGVCSHYPYGAYGKGKIGLTDNGAAVVYNPNGDYTGDEGGLANWKAYLAAQKEAGTPVQVAYQLAAPEVYATDPVDFDNAAGPLTVMTGGELEVRMTELVGSRTYDADGDGVVDRANSVDGGTY